MKLLRLAWTTALVLFAMDISAQSFQLPSKILDESIEIWVRLPDNYHRTTATFAVLYVLDADGLFNVAGEYVSYLSNEFVEYMPPMIVVGIRSKGQEWRSKHFSANMNDPKFLSFSGFLQDELIPTIEVRYRTNKLRLLVGHSLSGLFAIQFCAVKKEVFFAAISISPSLSRGAKEIPNVYATGTYLQPLLLHVSLAERDLPGYEPVIRSFIRDIGPPRSDSLRVSFQMIENTDHHTVAPTALYDGLHWVFDTWSFKDSKDPITIERVIDHYARLSVLYRCEQSCEMKLLWLGRTLYEENQANAAVKVFQKASSQYPSSPLSYYYLATVYLGAYQREKALNAINQAILLMRKIDSPDLDQAKKLREVILKLN